MRQVYNGVYFYLVQKKKMNMCASFYWEYVIMYLKFMFKKLNENIIFFISSRLK
jgi:hypothetical protein